MSEAVTAETQQFTTQKTISGTVLYLSTIYLSRVRGITRSVSDGHGKYDEFDTLSLDV